MEVRSVLVSILAGVLMSLPAPGSSAMEPDSMSVSREYVRAVKGKPLSVNASVMSDTGLDFDAESFLPVNSRWNTGISGHASGNIRTFDCNHDSFMDEPEMLRFSLANAWKYRSDNGIHVDFGAGASRDVSHGGQKGYDRNRYQEWSVNGASDDPWGADIINSSIDGFADVRIPLSDDNSKIFSVSADYAYTDTGSWFGASSWSDSRHSVSGDVIYRHMISPAHTFAVGARGDFDRYDSHIDRLVRSASPDPGTGLMQEHYDNRTVCSIAVLGVSGEYVFRAGDRFSSVARLGCDWYSGSGVKLSPSLALRYSPARQFVLALGVERKLGHASPLADNMGVFMTGKVFRGNFEDRILEDAWLFNGSLKYYLPFGASRDTYISIGYSRTSYAQQQIVDYEHIRNAISFYALDGKDSYSDSYRIDFNVEPVKRLKVSASFRYTGAKMELEGRGLVEKPMAKRYIGVLDMRYSTAADRWTFGVMASVNGPCRVYDFMKGLRDAGGHLLYADGHTPVYPLVNLQITRRFKSVEIYLGGENLTNFRQKDILVGARDSATGLVSPHQPSFDASAVWGPVTGIKIYAGIRYTLSRGR